MTHSNSKRVRGGRGGRETKTNTEEYTERWSRGIKGWDLFFSLLFFSVSLTQVSADMLGACPGVDYNIKTTTGKTRIRVRQKRSDVKATDSERDSLVVTIKWHYLLLRQAALSIKMNR